MKASTQVEQPRLPVPVPTEATYLAARASFIATMLPERQAAVLAHYANPKNQRALQWRS